MWSHGLSKYIETKMQTFAFTSYEGFSKNNKWSGTSLLAWFSAGLLIKNSLVIDYYLTKCHCLVAFTLKYWAICLLTRLWSQKSWNWFYLFNQAVFSPWPKCYDKILNILRTKRDFKMKKTFFFIFEEFSLK